MNTSSMQSAVAEEVNSRLSRATEELKSRYASGQGGQDQSVDGPTGEAYKEKHLKDQMARKAKKDKIINADERNQNNKKKSTDNNDLDEDGGMDEDYELRKIREARLKQIKQTHQQTLENISKGHGEYREIVQDQFLAEVTSSQKVICHFYHKEFNRCTIMDHHLLMLAKQHIETKFIKIDAEKTPFFVEKLRVRSMPTVVIFFDGVASDKIIGFEGLADTMPEGKEDEWSTVTLARLLSSKNAIDKDRIVDPEGKAAEVKEKMESLRRSALLDLDDDFDNLDLDNDD
eukprot:gene9051-12206_t